MAEERIFVAELTGVQYTCGIGGICSGKCEESGKCGKGISRQEAIDKISFALMMKGVDESDCKELAEAALNALLEE